MGWNRKTDALVTALRPRHFRGKRRLLNAWVGAEGTRQAQVFGAWFELDLSEFIQRNIYLGTFETLDARAVAACLGPGMTVVDAGANVGYYTALACACVGPSGRVIAFEPSPYAFERLRQMIARNRLPAETCPYALGAAAGAATLFIEPDANHSPSLASPGSPQARAQPVEVRTLDAEAQRLGLGRIDLLKADVEGWESHLLEGAAGLLRQRRIGAVLLEFNEPWLRLAGSSSQTLERQLLAAGFRHVTPRRHGHLDNRLYRLDN